MDTIANFLTSLRNAEMAHHSQVTVPLTKGTKAIAEVFKQKNFITSVTEVEKTLVITLTPSTRHHFKRVSKPGRRVYTTAREMPQVLGGFGTIILSTPDGVMTGSDAKKRKIGGEVLCEVY